MGWGWLGGWVSGCRLSCSRCSCKLLRLEQQRHLAAARVLLHLLLHRMRLACWQMMSWSFEGQRVLLLVLLV
jgi:hypothetical protein